MSTTQTSEVRTDRLSAVEGHWRADSLVGSFFHSLKEKEGEHIVCWQGCVVAEPNPGIYLVEVFEWLGGSSTHQELIRIEDMLDWHFYDDSKWMNSAYHNVWERRLERRERARERAEQERSVEELRKELREAGFAECARDLRLTTADEQEDR